MNRIKGKPKLVPPGMNKRGEPVSEDWDNFIELSSEIETLSAEKSLIMDPDTFQDYAETDSDFQSVWQRLEESIKDFEKFDCK